MRTMIIAAALILSTSLAYAGDGSCRVITKDARNLSPQQKEKVRELRRGFLAETAALKAAHRETLRQYQAARRAGDTVAAEALVPALESYRAEMKQRRAELETRIAAVVTPERQQ